MRQTVICDPVRRMSTLPGLFHMDHYLINIHRGGARSKGVYDLEPGKIGKNVILQNPGSLHFSGEFQFEPQILIRISRQPSSVAFGLGSKIEGSGTIN